MSAEQIRRRDDERVTLTSAGHEFLNDKEHAEHDEHSAINHSHSQHQQADTQNQHNTENNTNGNNAYEYCWKKVFSVCGMIFRPACTINCKTNRQKPDKTT